MRSGIISWIGLGLWLAIGLIWAALPASANPVLTGDFLAATAVGSGPVVLLPLAAAALAWFRRRPAR